MPIKPQFADLLGISRNGDDELRFLAEAGNMWLCMGEYGEAAAVFSGLTALAPNDPVGFLGLADIYMLAREFDQALKFFQKAASRENTDRQTMAQSYGLQAEALIELGRRDEARQAWRVAGELDRPEFWAEQAESRCRVSDPVYKAARYDTMDTRTFDT